MTYIVIYIGHHYDIYYDIMIMMTYIVILNDLIYYFKSVVTMLSLNRSTLMEFLNCFIIIAKTKRCNGP